MCGSVIHATAVRCQVIEAAWRRPFDRMGDAGGADQASLRLRLGEFGSKVSDSAECGVFGLLDQCEHGQTNREGAGAERAGERRSLLGLGEFSPGLHELRFRRGGLRDLIELDAVEQSRADQLARR